MQRIPTCQSLIAVLMLFALSTLPVAAQQPPFTDSQFQRFLADLDTRPEVGFPAYIADALKIPQSATLKVKGRRFVAHDKNGVAYQQHTIAKSTRSGDDRIILVFANADITRAFLTARDLKLRAAVEWSGASDKKLVDGRALASELTKPMGASAEEHFRTELSVLGKTHR